jgi:hypothetical protein
LIRPVSAESYLGREFDVKTSNCWHLVRDVWRDMTGVDLGDLTPAETDRCSLETAAGKAAGGPQFERLWRPKQPCIVLMRRRREMPHVGVLMRWRVLHLTPQGARNVWLSDLVLEWERVEYYLPTATTEAA